MRFRLMALAAVPLGVGVSGAVAASSPPIVPTTYNQTCQLVQSWCTPPVQGNLPPEIQRPLQLPSVSRGQACPVSRGRSFHTSEFQVIALGDGLVLPGITVNRPADAASAKRGLLRFQRQQRGWFRLKTLWFARPSYQGPLLIRGRRLDAPGQIVMGEGPTVIDPQLPPGPTVNDYNSWRTWPGGTYLRAPGCYGWQVDGENFTTVIVFRAMLVR